MKIFQANETHLDLVASLFNEYRVFYDQIFDLCKAENFIRDRLQKNDSIIFLVTKATDLTPLGFAQLYHSFTSIGAAEILILNDLYIKPEYRKNGIAGKLLMHIEEFAQKKGVAKITLQTAKSNSIAQKLYTSYRYKQEKNFLNFCKNV
ncbi:MAG: GNAT family N-acetyltransferase [Proteobacteria bacterium]|nr:GNAT family N-acetyltransferase [Pseudomonadota bacterium]